MWKDYSLSYIKKNKVTSIFLIVSAFIASFFISLVCSGFYNMWQDDIRRLMEAEGGWHVRITGEVTEFEQQVVEYFSGVGETMKIEAEQGTAMEIYFEHPSKVYEVMPLIAEKLELEESQVTYHEELLAKYFIFSPEESSPPLLLGFYVVVLFLTCISLILIIKNAFYFSMRARIHQLGILQSVGATPGQLRTVLLQEALLLCTVPILAGDVAGIGACMGLIKATEDMSVKMNLEPAVFQYHSLILILTSAASFLTVLLSAWLPARRFSRYSPLENISGESGGQVKRVRKYRIISVLFGIEGELAGKSLYSRRKAFRTASVCLTVSFLVFGMFSNFMTISEISTKYTYFERYKDSWDIMIELNDTNGGQKELLEEIRQLKGVSSAVSYLKGMAYVELKEEDLSEKVRALGGYGAINSEAVRTEKGWRIEAPLILLDDTSFERYCKEIGVTDVHKTGEFVIPVNWINVNGTYKNAEYIPFLKESKEFGIRFYADETISEELGEFKVCGFAQNTPNLREEYDHFSLVSVMPESLFQGITDKNESFTGQRYINIISDEKERIEVLEGEVKELLLGEQGYRIENRPGEEVLNGQMYDGYKKLTGVLCGLLAFIGIANVCANMLGYIYQRKKEFAAYQSVGLTPWGVNKMLCVEALLIGMRPILFSVPLQIAFIVFAVNASGLKMQEFMDAGPFVPMIQFSAAVLLAVSISCYIGGRKMKKCNLLDALKDDTML